MSLMRKTAALSLVAAALAGPAAALSISSPAGTVAVDAAAVAKLATQTETLSFLTHSGRTKVTLSGPLLWQVFVAVNAIDPAKPKQVLRNYVTVTGSDGYEAILSLAELSPDFEGKPILLATSENGKPLAAGAWRIAIPGDKRGGRDVRNVAHITITTIP